MDHPPQDPARLLEQWMEWERGDATPGRVMANLKTGGLRQVLEALVASAPAAAADGAADADVDAWRPTV